MRLAMIPRPVSGACNASSAGFPALRKIEADEEERPDVRQCQLIDSTPLLLLHMDFYSNI
jgi:hypothetical protein